ncbi:hypothetical protein BDV40DRAFT_298389 [Aspergillus tamarii]|uniref:Uncharacterized protein n=1 Tax=Aspergillus tamarii TaxID=41984 RepID=A0A5N6V0W4_ASPTM|nr:hypothetical protein BDV40DRAFT_298389 [Aspergillus tamarii]
MSKTTSSSTKSNPTTATTVVTGSTPNTESSRTSSQTTRNYAELDNISRYRESPSWMEPYYATERMKDREDHRKRIRDVIQGVEDSLDLDRKRS